MTLAEIQQWIKAHKCVDTVSDWYDENSNHETERIYKDGDKFYSIEFLNGHPYHDHGWRDRYSIREVVPVKRMIEVITYESPDPT